mgnify:CR=1 FL=1|jgi:hypothetical protein
MKLEKYLKEIRECPEEIIDVPKAYSEESGWKQMHKLAWDYGVRDNWPIFLNTDFQAFIRKLKDTGNYVNFESSRNGKRITCDYAPGTINLQIFDDSPLDMFTSTGFVFPVILKKDQSNLSEKEKKFMKKYKIDESVKEEILYHSNKQYNDYKISILLNNYQDKKILEMHDKRAFSKVIQEIGKLAIEERIPLCFPYSGPEISKKFDYSEVVYHEPGESK